MSAPAAPRFRYEVDTTRPLHKVVRAAAPEADTAAAQAEASLEADLDELRDGTALLEARARRLKQRAQALAAGLAADRRRRALLNPPLREGVSPFNPHARPRDVQGTTGAQVARARALARVSQRQLAAAWTYSRSVIAECERGARAVPASIGAWARQVLRVAGELEETESPAGPEGETTP